jgi:hypothetical protein
MHETSSITFALFLIVGAIAIVFLVWSFTLGRTKQSEDSIARTPTPSPTDEGAIFGYISIGLGPIGAILVMVSPVITFLCWGFGFLLASVGLLSEHKSTKTVCVLGLASNIFPGLLAFLVWGFMLSH